MNLTRYFQPIHSICFFIIKSYYFFLLITFTLQFRNYIFFLELDLNTQTEKEQRMRIYADIKNLPCIIDSNIFILDWSAITPRTSPLPPPPRAHFLKQIWFLSSERFVLRSHWIYCIFLKVTMHVQCIHREDVLSLTRYNQRQHV